jgi:hypothetical protein
MRAVKSRKIKEALKLGDLITRVYDVCGKRRAKAILRLAFKEQVAVFGGRRYVLSGGNKSA